MRPVFLPFPPAPLATTVRLCSWFLDNLRLGVHAWSAQRDRQEPTTARFAGSWWRFGALAGHNALKIGHPASNCAVVLQVSAGFLSMPPIFCPKDERDVRAESEVLLNALLMWF